MLKESSWKDRALAILKSLCLSGLSGAQFDYFRGLRSFRPFRNIKFYGLTFGKALIPVTFDNAVVNEYVFAYFIRLDEAVTFGAVEPLYFTLHKAIFLLKIYSKTLLSHVFFNLSNSIYCIL